MSNAFALNVRQARPEDAVEIARVYIESWHDTYAGVLPHALLRAMTPKEQAARWRAAIAARPPEAVLAAECGAGIVGMANFGPTRDAGLGYDGEIYSLYVDPSYYGLGIGRRLLRAAFEAMNVFGMSSCVAWAHARAQSRFFYGAMGGKLVAERANSLMGERVPEAAYGWRTLALAERSPAAR